VTDEAPPGEGERREEEGPPESEPEAPEASEPEAPSESPPEAAPESGPESPPESEPEVPEAPSESRRRRPRWRDRRAVRVAAVVLGVLLAAGALFYFTLPNGSEYARRWPRRTAYMELRIQEAREAGHTLRIRYRPVPISRIPRPVRRAVLVAEDAGFYGHGAFDWAEIRAAIEQAWREHEAPRGASTITQQLARNLYLSPRRSLGRKVREALIAVRLEHALSKRRILELYLNVIELGPGIFGVRAASEAYFGLPVDALGPDEAVRLAATIPSPLHDNPDSYTRAFRWRVRLIADRAFPAEAADSARADTTEGAATPDSSSS
jgi:monofunctional biosynthetic peptidoglycan transglycosylase